MNAMRPVTVDAGGKRITFRVRWWFRLYLAGLTVVVLVTHRPPDPCKIAYWLARALYVDKIVVER